jgi:anthranilate synthase component 1
MAHLRRLNYQRDPLLLHEANPARYPFLLQSVAHGPHQARYDILFAFPGESLRLSRHGELSGPAFQAWTGDFLGALDTCWQREGQQHAPSPELPFSGGWFVYLGYELAAQVEPSLELPSSKEDLPTAVATRIPAAVILDHEAGETVLVAEQADLLPVLEADYHGTAEAAVEDTPLSGQLTEDDPQRYLAGVRRVKDYIVEGDVFQVNLSRAWRGRLAPAQSPAVVYRRLRQHNPAPFAGLAVFEEGAVISSSPERLVKVAGRHVETRPIAGTRPRRPEPAQDAALQAELLAHPKERAEHIMLIDLERNDLGRVCEPGTVKVDELMVLESYAHVHHIVSNVCGRLRENVTPGQVIRAVFPGGTITGCPKVRCMEIIAELEAEGRGAYTGAMGYLNHDGSMDLNILIRTMVLEGERLSLRAGAGIVADSIPDKELEETRAKARGLLLALGLPV